jgi:Protein of unknown function (DUF3575)
MAATAESFAQMVPRPSSDKVNGEGPDSADAYRRPHVLKTNFLGPFSLLYEQQWRPQSSWQVSVDGFKTKGSNSENKYFALTAAYKFYFPSPAGTLQRPDPAGWYISPYLRYLNVRDSKLDLFSNEKYAEVSYRLFGRGATLGYQIIYQKGITLDFFAGGGYLPLHSSKVKYYLDQNSKPALKP